MWDSFCLRKKLHHISAQIHIPLLGITVTLVMLAVAKLLQRGCKLKKDNDLFI